MLLAGLLRDDPSIYMLDLSHQNLVDSDILLLCMALTRNTQVNTLLLSSNLITDQGAYQIVNLLRKNPYIERVELARNSMISEQCIEAIQCEFLDRFSNIGWRVLSLNPHRNIKKIDEKYSIDSKEFVEHFFEKQYPLLIKNAVIESEACKLWSPQYFNDKMAENEVRLTLHSLQDISSHYYSKMSSLYLKMNQAIPLIEAPSKTNTFITRFYIQQISLNNFPEIKEQIKLPAFCSDVDNKEMAVNLWFGQKDTYSPLHYDAAHNFFAQIYGRKIFMLYAPSDSKYLFQHAPQPASIQKTEHLSQIKNIDLMDDHVEISKQATPYQVVVEPGDVLFIPKGWWHEVRSADTSSISVSHWFKNKKKSNFEVENLLNQFFIDHKKPVEIITQCTTLVLQNSDPNYMTDNLFTLLQLAVRFHVNDAVEALLNHPSIDQDLVDISNKYTPFFLTIKFGYVDTLDLFLKHSKTNVHQIFECTGHTPLTLAAEEGHLLIIKRLIMHGASVFQQDGFERRPLQVAINHFQQESIMFLQSFLHLQEKNEESHDFL